MSQANGERMFEFPGEYYEIIRRDFRNLEAETAFFESYLPDTSGAVLDVGCGSGSNLRPLAARGHRCVGVDQSEEFIDYARRQGGSVTYHRGVAADLTIARASLDLAFAVFVTLNYFSRDELTDVFERVAGWLKPGGRFVVDIGHMLNFVENYQPYIIAHHRDQNILITRFIRHFVRPHDATWRHEETILVRDGDDVRMYDNFFDQQVLTAPEVGHLLADAGLVVVESFSDFAKAAPAASGRGHLVMVAALA